MNRKAITVKPDDAEITRRVTNKSRILAALIKAGPAGVTNAQLSEIHLRYGVSIHQLTHEGHVITNTLIKGGLRRYVLAPETPGAVSQGDGREQAFSLKPAAEAT